MKALALGIAALLLVGLTLPLAMAHPGLGRMGDLRKDERGPKADKRHDADLTNFTIAITATGVDRDNQTYTLEASGEGSGKAQERGNRSRLHGFAVLDARVLDANGTLVKEGEIRVRLVAHESKDGEWTWRLVSVARTPKGVPHLFLHGHNGTFEDGVGDLEGRGLATFKADDAEKRVRVRLDADVHIENV